MNRRRRDSLAILMSRCSRRGRIKEREVDEPETFELIRWGTWDKYHSSRESPGRQPCSNRCSTHPPVAERCRSPSCPVLRQKIDMRGLLGCESLLVKRGCFLEGVCLWRGCGLMRGGRRCTKNLYNSRIPKIPADWAWSMMDFQDPTCQWGEK